MENQRATQETNDHDLLIELRSEVKGLRNDIKDMRDNIAQRVRNLEESKIDRHEIDILNKKNDEEHEFNTKEHQNFVTKDEFGPIKSLVYGEVAIILTTVLAAVLYLVINKPA